MKVKTVIVAIFLPLCVFAQQRAVVNVSAAYLRSAPDYESSLETQELMGVEVQVLAKDRYWVQVTTPQPYTAWVNEKALVMMTDEQADEYAESPKYRVIAMHGWVLETPSRNARAMCDIVAGDVLRIDAERKRIRGYSPVLLPDGRKGWVRSDAVCRQTVSSARERSLSQEEAACLAAKWAENMLGVPYLWGGMSTKGADCSGLVRLAYMMNGIILPRNADQQYAAGEDIPISKTSGGQFDLTALRAGDLLFFGPQRADLSRSITHVGIYLGDGRMIHSSQIVRINSLRFGSPDAYENLDRLHKACRIRR